MMDSSTLTLTEPAQKTEYHEKVKKLYSHPLYALVSGNEHQSDFLYIGNNTGTFQIHLWDSGRAESRLLTPDKEPVAGQASLHASRPLVVFGKDQGGNQDYSIFILDYSTNKIEQITRKPLGRVFHIFWISDDEWVVVGHDKDTVYARVLSRDGSIRDVYTTDKQILTADYDEKRKMLALSVGRGESTHLAVIDVEEPKVVNWISEAERSQDYYPAILPENGFLAYETDAARTSHEIVIRSVETLEIIKRFPIAGELPWGMMYPLHWLDEDTLFVVITKDAQISPHKLNLRTGKLSQPLAKGTVSSAALAKNGPVWISSKLTESDSIQGLSNDGIVTFIPSGTETKAGVESHWYESFDGRRVQGWLVRGETPDAPLIVYCHGGPTFMAGNWWDPSIMALVQSGYNVFAPNYRGSISFGSEFRDLNVSDLGGGDLKDVLHAAKYAATLLGQRKKPAILGGSYGGYLTLQALTTQPDEWAGGVAMVPITDWAETYELSDAHYRAWNTHFLGGPPEEKPELYKERSPITQIARLKNPVLILCGENDPVANVQPVRKFAEEAGKRGLPVELVVAKDEGHGPISNENMIRDTILTLEHLKKLYRN